MIRYSNGFQGFIGDVYGLESDTEKTCGCLVKHPYIASLWLGSLALRRLRLNRVLHRSLALFCLLPSYFQAFANRLTKGSKGPFVIYAPILVFEWGQCYTRHFVLYIMDPVQIIANIYVTSFLVRQK